MSPVAITLLVIVIVLAIIIAVLYFLGKKAQKKQAEQQELLDANKQTVSMLIIDKKRMKMKDAGLPQMVIDQTPKMMRGSKLPIIKAKVGPQIVSLICDEKIFESVPVKKEVKAVVSGITRTTGKAELVRAALDCIVYQISDVVNAMAEDSGIKVDELRVDGGPTKNGYLMQFQSDILDIPVQVPDAEELSAMGPAYAAGIAMGIYEQTALFESLNRTRFTPEMDAETRCTKYTGWKESVGLVLTK